MTQAMLDQRRACPPPVPRHQPSRAHGRAFASPFAFLSAFFFSFAPACASPAASAQGQRVALAPNLDDLSLDDLSLEALRDVRVTSVSRRDQALLDAAASIYVIGGEEIRRLGAR